MPSPLQILAHTPPWVWPLLLLIVVLGLRDLRPRTIHPAGLAPLPLVGLTMSVLALVQSPRMEVSMVAWTLALLAALPLGLALAQRRSLVRLADGRLQSAGSWFTLIFGLSIFALRFALGVVFGTWPEVKGEPTWLVLSAALGGLVAGIGIGWLGGLLRRVQGIKAAG